jgi:hypothetical protein
MSQVAFSKAIPSHIAHGIIGHDNETVIGNLAWEPQDEELPRFVAVNGRLVHEAAPARPAGSGRKAASDGPKAVIAV